MRRLLVPFLFTSVALFSACSSSDTDKAQSSVEASSGFNDADVMFARMMIPHHEQAIEMADIALDPTSGASQEVKDMATQIKGAQDPEIAQMTQLLKSWGKSLEMDSGGMDHSSMMDGMLSTEEMAAFATLSGTKFDVAWIEGMIAHHEGAIDMADGVVSDGKNADITQLGNAIISGQKAEIETLKNLLGNKE